MLSHSRQVLTRAVPGVRCLKTPLPQAFGTPVNNIFRTGYNLKSRSEVTQGQVTTSIEWPRPEKVWMLVIPTPNDQLQTFIQTEWSAWNFQRLISVTVGIYRNVYFGILLSMTQGRVNFGTSPLGISQSEKNGMRRFCRRNPLETPKHQVTGRFDTLRRNIATSDPSSCRQGHFRSWKFTPKTQWS